MSSSRRRETLFLVAVLLLVQIHDSQGADCKPEELKYEFTECDSSDGRWRVAVPKKVGSCEAKEALSRQEKCVFTCDPGSYLDVNSAKLECKKCPKGHYSVGGGVRFTDWSKLPVGFDVHSSQLRYRGYGYDNEFNKEKGVNCSKTGWTPLGDSVATSGEECTSQLSYAVTLKKDGFVKFKYHFTDNMYTVFKVFLRNDQCRASSNSKHQFYPENTMENEWVEKKIDLKAGRNLITWEVSALTYGSHERRDPVYISEIEIQGVAYTSECQMCEEGYFAKDEGSAFCEICPKNTMSVAGASKCSKCNEVTEYSAPGSKNCSERKPCTQQDYYDTRTACNGDHKTQVKYKWIEPKICRDDVQGAVKLPASGAMEECPPCNPGMKVNGTGCVFCPANQFSDGIKECKPCPVSTSPMYGYDIKWWRSIPPNMKASCFSISERGCTSRIGWQPHGNYISSGINHGDDVYLLLKLTTKGFGPPQGKAGVYGMVTFVFEMDCEGDCLFKFKKTEAYKGETIVESWKGKHTKTKYSYIVSSQGKTTFRWTFQKFSSDDSFTDQGLSESHKYSNDRVKIYSLNVTNTLDGGAASCKDCPVTSKDSCVSCPTGNYIDEAQKKCVPCPKNTFLNVTHPYGLKACLKCGPGLVSDEGSISCHSDCKFTSKKFNREFDFSKLQGQVVVAGAPSFTTRGSRYYHVFHISLCGHPYKESVCHSNVSVNTGRKEEFNLSSSICRYTMIPNQQGSGLAAQPIRIGQELNGIYEDRLHNETSAFEDAGIIKNTTTHFNYHYHSAEPTAACPSGRHVVVTLMCDHAVPKKGVLELPAKCPDGTCDGCKFQFLWRTKYACPECSAADYKKVKGACEHGHKTTSYMWKEPKTCRDGVSLPAEIVEECSILDQTVGSAMKDFKIGIGVAAALAVLLICSVCFLYCKNRKLTYKYSRLVQNGTGHPDELPHVEKCGMDDDEEDEDEEVMFKRGAKERGKKILKSLRGLASKGRKHDKVTFDDEDDGGDEEYFESVQLEAVRESSDRF
ncbi:UPF0577 protein KIAA1324-like [Exaiptasia diaphana]|uniref:MRH domain-containing protein n=1 Tax=Exaiptasia diaphana TaxID=2652724 RepID=A0A913YPQ3_EXADI|nr:UPF0577 protein KIAA1324-like [Exaiptasia diaphana]